MEVNKWFDSDCNYHEGITLYMQQKGHSSNLVRLFLRKQSTANEDKLKYELSKFKTETPIASPDSKTSPQKRNIAISINGNPKPLSQPRASNPSYFYRLNQLHTDLHPLAIKQRNDFQLAISQKLILNQQHPSEEGVSLSLCLSIEDLFDAIETAQKILDHYVFHKVVLNTKKRDFADLTGDQRLQRRANKRISVSKYSKKIAKIETDLQKEQPLSIKTKLQVLLEKAKSKLLEHEFDIQQLNELINTPT